MSWCNERKFTYVKKDKTNDNIKNNKNRALEYSRKIFKSDRERYDSHVLINDYKHVLDGGCIYLPYFFCDGNDYHLFDSLKNDLINQSDNTIVQWNNHKKHGSPDFSATFNDIVNRMAKHFNVDVLTTRLNYYENGRDWKTFHHDRNAFNKKYGNFTMGASFGSTRALDFKHEESDTIFSFPQNNGDVFAFNDEINKKFVHGIPKANNNVGERISIIAWGVKH